MESCSPFLFVAFITKKPHEARKKRKNHATDADLDGHSTHVSPRRVNPYSASGSSGFVEQSPQSTPVNPRLSSHATLVPSGEIRQFFFERQGYGLKAEV